MSRELPIIFCPEMVKAIQEGRKTNTRRIEGLKVLNEHPELWRFLKWNDDGCALFITDTNPSHGAIIKPRYQVGDLLWAKEAHYLYGQWLKNGQTKTGRQKWRFIYEKAKKCVRYPDAPPNLICTKKEQIGWFKRTGRFMPKWAARLWLRVTAVKDPHQIQSISEHDARAEGAEPQTVPFMNIMTGKRRNRRLYYPGFCMVWKHLHGFDSWENNDWVFGYEFERIEK